MRDAPPSSLDIAVIGAGFGGIGMAIALLAAGRRDFAVFERADDLGGTWRDNRYPGCACDVPSHLYSYSFAPNPAWSHRYAGWAEILQYLRGVATRHGVLPHLRCGHAVTRIDYDEARARWRLRFADGRMVEARVVVSATGGFSTPRPPAIPGHETFAGASCHSARWDDTIQFAGRRVAVIGTGASAIQLVPRLAAQAAALTVFQRSAPWVVPRRDRALRASEQRRYARWPALQRLHRGAQYALAEGRIFGFVLMPWLRRLAELEARWHLRRQVADPLLRARLTPDYPLGCKRVLVSDDYYPALARAHVSLVDTPIERIGPAGLRTIDGREHAVDAIIHATGFEVAGKLPFAVHGRGGRSLDAEWAGGGEAYYGLLTAGYPNLFTLLGPNTGLAHSSVIYMLESQVRYVIDALALLDRAGARTLEPRPEAQAAFVRGVDRRLAGSVWTRCHSWYRGRDGRVSAIWPDFTFRYRARTRRADPRDLLLS